MTMAAIENELSIQSRHGLLRDVVPVYSLYQLLLNLVTIGLALWVGQWLGHLPQFVLFIILLSWVVQFGSRPSVMRVSKEQATWLETVLEGQGLYDRSEIDGRWRKAGMSWRRLPHHSIEFVTGSEVTVIAPREVMESMRAGIELMEEHGELFFASDNQPFVFESPEPEAQFPWQTRVPAGVLGGACVIASIWALFTDGFEGVTRSGLSAAALSEGRFETIFTHMFVHGGGMHLVMNMTALAAIGPTLASRLGPVPRSWLRFWLLFFVSALAGAALYLALHPAGTVPMVGASGGLYGLLGLVVRAPANGEAVLALQSSRIRRMGWNVVQDNIVLFGILMLMSWSSGVAGGLAWEAHLGGFLFGLCIGPKLLPPRERPASPEEPISEATVPAN